MTTIDEIQIIKEVVNKNFTFGDLNSKYQGMSSQTGNFFCPFHDNFQSPAAKFYEDEDRQVLWCFSEHRMYTPYDYVNLILCKKWGRYKNVMEFLSQRLGHWELKQELKLASTKDYNEKQENFQKSIDDINNIYNDCDDITEYIERLYNTVK